MMRSTSARLRAQCAQRCRLAAVAVLSCGSLMASPPETLWTRVFGGEKEEWGWWVEECYDSGFIMAGRTFSYPNNFERSYVVKTNRDGDLEWSRVLSCWNSRNNAYCVRQTHDSGFIVAGHTEAFGHTGILYKLGAAGESLWQHYYAPSQSTYLFEVAETPDFGFVATGQTYTSPDWNLYVVKTDSYGNIEWEREYGGSNYDKGEAVICTSDSGYAVLGTTGSSLWLLKLGPSGDSVWARIYGAATGRALMQTPDCGFVLAGEAYYGPSTNGLVIRTDSSGDTIWKRTPGDYQLAEHFESVRPTSDGGYVLGGWHYPNENDINVWLAKFDSAGNEVWVGSYGGDSAYDYGYSAQEVSSGGYVVVGRTDDHGAGNYDLYLVRMGEGTAIDEQKLPVARQTTIRGDVRSTLIAGTGLELRESNLQPPAARPKRCDISGRGVYGARDQGNRYRLAPGVYFLCPAASLRPGLSGVTKVIVTR
ncbi:MAG: hypothetical protein ABIK62_00040 [candidate division WOR-3 bacterium]